MKKKVILLIFVFLLIISNLGTNKILATDIKSENEKIDSNEDIFKEITAPNLILAETNTGRILYERNVDERIYPASLTKLLTAILVVENSELDEIVTVSENAVFSVPVGYVNANLQVGEQLTVEDLLYVMLIPSANDAANALAEHIGGSIESFSTMMNTRAKEIGCTGSNFTNPSGLHEKEHYTTARDLLLISNKAFENTSIQKILKTTTYTLPSTNKYTKEERKFITTNYMIRKNLKKFYCDYCIGAKTGYTGEAKNCVVEFAKKDGINLTAIIMGEQARVKGQKFIDAKIMFEYVFDNFTQENIVEKGKVYETIKVCNGTKETRNLDVIYKNDVSILKDKRNDNKIEEEIQYNRIIAPIKKGDVLGKIMYNYEGIKYETELIANNDVEESKQFTKFFKISIIAIIIYIIYKAKKSNKKYGNHGKKYKNKKIKKNKKK